MKNVERLLLRPVEAAEVLGVSKARMYDLLRQGKVPCIELGRSRTKRIPLDRLKLWVEEKLAEVAQVQKRGA
jgi:excisionase family DNA binding protein